MIIVRYRRTLHKMLEYDKVFYKLTFEERIKKLIIYYKSGRLHKIHTNNVDVNYHAPEKVRGFC